MSYISETCGTLTRTLEKFVTLNAYQLSGQFANFDFWLKEVEHATAVIDDYPARFERLKTAQVAHVKRRGTVQFALDDPYALGETPPPPQSGVPDSERKEIRKALLNAAYQFVVRCGNARLMDRDGVKQSLSRLGIDLNENDLK